MKKLTRVHPLMSEAFIIWLVSIGYRGVTNAFIAQYLARISRVT